MLLKRTRLFDMFMFVIALLLSSHTLASNVLQEKSEITSQLLLPFFSSVIDANMAFTDFDYHPITVDSFVESLPSAQLISLNDEVVTEDSILPELVSLDITPKEVDVTNGKQTVVVNISVREDTAMYLATITFRYPSLDIYKSAYSSYWVYNPITELYDTSVSLVLDQNVVGGTWELTDMSLYDQYQNSISIYSTNSFEELGFNPYLDVINSNDVDITPPELVYLSITPQEVDVTSTDQIVTVNLSVRDESGMEFASFWLRYPPLGLYKSAYTTDWIFNDQTQTYDVSVSFTLDKTLIGGEWEFSVVGYLADKLGNNTYDYENAEKLANLGFNPYLSVINTNEVDTTPPELVVLTIDQQEADVSSTQQTVKVHLAVRDESGMDVTTFWIRNPELGIYRAVYTSEWSYNSDTQLYESSLLFTVGQVLSGTWEFSVVGAIADKLGNSTYDYSSAEKLVAKGFSPYITVANGQQSSLFDAKVAPSDDYSQISTYQKALFNVTVQNNKEYDLWVYAKDVTRLTGISFAGSKSVSNACVINNFAIQCRISSVSDSNELVTQISSYALDVSKYSVYMVLKPVGEPFESDWSSNYAHFPSLDVDADGINNDVDLDDDNDGLSDEEELVLGANPFWKDTDGDGIDDNVEVINGLNPVDASDALADFDNDGLNNSLEITLGTNVNKRDSDGDCVDDGEELSRGSNPLDPHILVGKNVFWKQISDTNGDNVSDWLIYSYKQNSVNMNLLSGDDFSLLNSYQISTTFPVESIYVLGDRNSDSVDDLGVFGFDASLNRYQLQVHSGLTGAKLDVWNWPATLGEVKFQALTDLTGDGIQEYAISGIHLVNGTQQLVVKDGVSKSPYQTFKWPNLWDKPQFVTMSDVTFDGVPEVALYGRHSRLDKGQLFVYDGLNANSKVDVYNWNKLWSDIQLVEMDDVDGDGTIDWGQFGQRKDDGRYQWVVKKGSDKRGVIRTFSWPNDLIDVRPMLVADRTGDGIREVAVLGTSPDSGKVFLRINDGRLANTRIANISWPASWEDIQVSELGDLNNDGFSEFGLLGFTKESRSVQLVIRDGLNFSDYGRVPIPGKWENLSLIRSDNANKRNIVILGTDQNTSKNISFVIDSTTLQVTQKHEI